MLERPLIAGSALVGMSSLLLSWSIGSVVNYAAVQRALGVSIAGREMPRSGSGVARVMAALAGRSGTPLSRNGVLEATHALCVKPGIFGSVSMLLRIHSARRTHRMQTRPDYLWSGR
jgi:hypothetical protein